MYYAGISSLLSVVFGTGLGYFCFKLFKKAGADYAEYEFPLIPILAVIVVFILLEILITYLIEGRLKKESIIDRIRYSE
jgi:putative ABC transport system permease protein